MADQQPTPVTPSEKSAAPSKPPINDIKAQKIAKLTALTTALTAELAATKTKLDSITAVLQAPAPQTVQKHIALLHQYNEIRDIGQGLLGMVAENRGVRVRELYVEGEFGVGIGD